MKRGLSQRQACRLFSVARSALSYQSKLAIKDAPALMAMRRPAREYPRFGYRRIAILLRREGFPMSFDRAWRLWRTAQLQDPRKRRRRRPASSRPRPRAPEQRHHVWAYDFVFDRCANGQASQSAML
jgi:putative transposase